MKESKANERIKDMEAKLKFYVETQELIDQKNEKIKKLEEKLDKLNDTTEKPKENESKNIKNSSLNKTNKSSFKETKENKMDAEIKITVLKEQNLSLQKKS